MNYSLLFAIFILQLLIIPVKSTHAHDGKHGDKKAMQTNLQNEKKNRIISAGGSITEILFGLGIGDDIIAVDSTSNYPTNVKELPIVGYFRRLSTEGILSLKPNLLIGAKGTGSEETLKQIEQFGVTVKVLDQKQTDFESWKKLVTDLGSYFNQAELAQQLVDKTQANLDKIKPQKTINAVTLLSLGQRAPIAAGKNTVPNMLFQLAGVNNIAKQLDGYQPISSELLASQQIDLIVIPSHFAATLGNTDEICQNKSIKIAMKGDKCPVHIMDGLLLLGFGSRIDQATQDIYKQTIN